MAMTPGSTTNATISDIIAVNAATKQDNMSRQRSVRKRRARDFTGASVWPGRPILNCYFNDTLIFWRIRAWDVLHSPQGMEDAIVKRRLLVAKHFHRTYPRCLPCYQHRHSDTYHDGPRDYRQHCWRRNDHR